MPQPFLRVVPKGGSVMIHTPEDPIFPKCPDLSLLALSAIASWSNVDLALLRVFMQLMGGPESMSASIYVALGGQTAKNAAIHAAARSALSARPNEYALLKALLKLAKTNQKFRDKLAHWVWAYSPALPDALLLMDPMRNYGNLHKKDILAFTASDFEPYIAANKRLQNYCGQLEFVIAVPQPTAKRQSIFKRLNESPEVKAALEQLAVQSDEA